MKVFANNDYNFMDANGTVRKVNKGDLYITTRLDDVNSIMLTPIDENKEHFTIKRREYQEIFTIYFGDNLPNFRTHNLKIEKNFADAILMGDKTFEIRKNDRGYQKGDYITFEVMEDSYFHDTSHKLNDKEFQITYVLNGWGLKEDFVALGLREVEHE